MESSPSEMTAERWEQLKHLFDEALEASQEQRALLLGRAGAFDISLCAEVEYLLLQHELAGHFLEGAAPVERQLALKPQQLLCDRYEIIRFLGRGGMAEVYEALDHDLRCSVALKVILPHLAQDRRSLERFRQEVLLSRRITHPNVCRIFDLARSGDIDDGFLFITMELVQGETLASRLKREGPISVTEAAVVLKQVADALAAAHQADIVHRDLKPGNIMLSDGPGDEIRVVVTDFGLARNYEPRADGEASLTGSGWIAGTPAYMAPEQLAGEKATPVSDIYSFGVVAFETLTGKKPFASPLQPNRTVPDVRREAPRAPAAWARAIETCLAQDPRARFDSVHEAWTCFAGQRSLVASRLGGARRTMLRAAAVAAIALAVVALLAFGFRYFRQRRPTPGATLVLADIMNATHDKSLDAVDEMWRQQLQQSASYELWDRSRLPDALARMQARRPEHFTGDITRQVAMRESIPYLVLGSVSPLGDGLTFNIELEEMEARSVHPRNVWRTTAYAFNRSALPNAVHDASVWLRRTMGESGNEIASRDRLPQDITTPSWEALAEYDRAERFRSNGDSLAALSALGRATALDPHFALAQMRAGDILMSLRRQEEGLKTWAIALEESNRQHLSRREELRIRGLYSSDAGDYATAEAVFRDYSKEYPLDFLGPFYLGNSLRLLNRLSEAVGAFQAALIRNPKSWQARANLACVCIESGSKQCAQEQIEALKKSGHADVASHYAGILLYMDGRYDSAETAFRTESQSTDADASSRGWAALGSLYAELGRYTEARVALQDGEAADNRNGRMGPRARKLVSLAYLALREPSQAGVRILVQKALSMDRSPEVVELAGTVLARAHFLKESRDLLRECRARPLRVPKLVAACERLEGEILVSEGSISAALAPMERASAAAPPLALRDYVARVYALSGKSPQALQLYARLQEEPHLFLWCVDRYFPGAISDGLLEYANAATRAGRHNLAHEAAAAYLRRRGTAGEISGELSKARLILAELDKEKNQ
jgi:tetratricopeptide (TPR) repeat protein